MCERQPIKHRNEVRPVKDHATEIVELLEAQEYPLIEDIIPIIAVDDQSGGILNDGLMVDRQLDGDQQNLKSIGL